MSKSFDVRVGELVVSVESARLYGGSPARLWGRPDDMEPEDPPELEYDVVSVDLGDGETLLLWDDASEYLDEHDLWKELDDAVVAQL